MKLSREASKKLGVTLEQERRLQGYSYRGINMKTGVDPGHAHNICHGAFATLNPSVLKICNLLGIDPTDPNAEKIHIDASRKRIAAEVMALWDMTPKGARRLVALLEQIRAFAAGERSRRE